MRPANAPAGWAKVPEARLAEKAVYFASKVPECPIQKAVAPHCVDVNCLSLLCTPASKYLLLQELIEVANYVRFEPWSVCEVIPVALNEALP